MNEDVSFLMKHRSKGALLDANLLLVYVVGKCRPSQLTDFHHTKQYKDDFPLIEKIDQFFRTIYTTPNVLTEVSNLGKKLGSDFFNTLGRVAAILDEQYYASKDASISPHFQRLGLTDAGLCMVAAQHLVVTTDFALYQILRAKRVDAINFNHLRPLTWKGGFPTLR